MGLKGKPAEVQEIRYYDEEGSWYEGDASRMTFSPEGRITSYQPVWMRETEGEPYAMPHPMKRSFSETLCEYEYRYDTDGRLTEIRLSEWGADMPMSFRLTYGTSTRYVPLPCPLGTCPFFLVQGVSTITAEGRDFSMTEESNELLYTTQQQTWRGTAVEQTRYVYEANADYPSQSITTTTLRGIEQTRTETQYEFADDGTLQTTRSTRFENGSAVHGTTCRYRTGSLLLPASKNVIPAEGASYTLTYAYDPHGNPVSITRSTEEEAPQAETTVYESHDAEGNWTVNIATTSSLVDPSHNDAIVRTERTIAYH